MIQRLQSLYLSLTTILSLLFLKGPFLTFVDRSETVISLTFRGIVKGADGLEFEVFQALIPLSVLIICIPIIALITIFLYKNRSIQLKMAFLGILLGALLVSLTGYYSINIIGSYNASIQMGIKMIFPFLILLFNILAYYGIRKDDRLVKSYDRLR